MAKLTETEGCYPKPNNDVNTCAPSRDVLTARGFSMAQPRADLRSERSSPASIRARARLMRDHRAIAACLRLHHPLQAEHREGRHQRGNRGRIQDVLHRPVRRHESPHQPRSQNRAGASDPQRPADPGRSQIRRVVHGRHRVDRRLSADDARSRDEDDGDQHPQREARLADRRDARRRDEETRRQHAE